MNFNRIAIRDEREKVRMLHLAKANKKSHWVKAQRNRIVAKSCLDNASQCQNWNTCLRCVRVSKTLQRTVLRGVGAEIFNQERSSGGRTGRQSPNIRVPRVRSPRHEVDPHREKSTDKLPADLRL